MSNESLGDTRMALEEAFFARENEKLRLQLRDLDNTKRKKEALSAASGITNDAALEKLAALNISSETVAALALVPLIAIAWSDGSIDDKERAAVLAKAQEEGVSQGNVSYELFQRWLSERPPANLLGMWKDCAKSPGGCLSTTVHKQYRCGAYCSGTAARPFLAIWRSHPPVAMHD